MITQQYFPLEQLLYILPIAAAHLFPHGDRCGRGLQTRVETVEREVSDSDDDDDVNASRQSFVITGRRTIV